MGDEGRECGTMTRAKALAREEKRRREAKSREARWVDVTAATSRGDVGMEMRACRRGVIGGGSLESGVTQVSAWRVVVTRWMWRILTFDGHHRLYYCVAYVVLCDEVL